MKIFHPIYNGTILKKNIFHIFLEQCMLIILSDIIVGGLLKNTAKGSVAHRLVNEALNFIEKKLKF